MHLHTLALDGAYEENAAGRLRFIATPPPRQADIRRVVEKVHARVQALLGVNEAHDDPRADDDNRLLFALGGAAIANRNVTESGTLRPVERVGPPYAMNMRIRPLQMLLPIGTARTWATACMPKCGWGPRPAAPGKAVTLRFTSSHLPQRLCELDDGRLGYALKTAVVGWHDHGRVCTAGIFAEAGDMGAATATASGDLLRCFGGAPCKRRHALLRACWTFVAIAAAPWLPACDDGLALDAQVGALPRPMASPLLKVSPQQRMSPKSKPSWSVCRPPTKKLRRLLRTLVRYYR